MEVAEELGVDAAWPTQIARPQIVKFVPKMQKLMISCTWNTKISCDSVLFRNQKLSWRVRSLSFRPAQVSGLFRACKDVLPSHVP